MRVVPRNIGPKITFFQAHLAKWQENAGQLGVSEEQVAEVAALVAEAKAAYLAQGQARSAARSATLRLHDVIGRLSEAGSNVIQQVRTTARAEGDGIFALADVAPPAAPAPVGAPGRPDRLKTELLGNGALRLTWTCKNPPNATGTMYQISRRVYVEGDGGRRGGQGGDEPIGLVGKRRFVDETLPPGTRTAVYQIRAVRSTTAGPAATFNVNFHLTGPRSSDSFRPLGGDAVAA